MQMELPTQDNKATLDVVLRLGGVFPQNRDIVITELACFLSQDICKKGIVIVRIFWLEIVI